MAWNDPGGNKPRDPWGGRGGDQGPPDLDEVLNNLRKRFGGLFGGGGGKRDTGGGGSPVFWGAIVAVLALMYLIWGFYAVEQQERAVVLSFGKYDRTAEPGLNWHWPPVEQYFKVNVQQTRSYPLTEDMLTADTNIVGVSLEVQYKVVDAQAFILRVSRPEELLHHATESALRQVVGSSSMDDVLVDQRQSIGVDIGVLLQQYLDSYNSGIRVVNFVLSNTQAPEPVRDAFNDVARAKEDEDRVQKEADAYANRVIPEARGRAQRLRAEAEAYKEQVIAEAEGDAQRFEDLLTEYRKAPAVTRERLYIETIQEVLSANAKVLVDVEGGNNMMYLPLDQILKQQDARRQSSGESSEPLEYQRGSTQTSSDKNSGGYGTRSRELR